LQLNNPNQWETDKRYKDLGCLCEKLSAYYPVCIHGGGSTAEQLSSGLNSAVPD